MTHQLYSKIHRNTSPENSYSRLTSFPHLEKCLRVTSFAARATLSLAPLSPTLTWQTPASSGLEVLLKSSSTELSQGAFVSFSSNSLITKPTSQHRTLMKEAMEYITSKSPCVTFVPGNSSSINYVMIAPGPNCSSERGMRGGQQLIYMNDGCFRNGLIVPVHELLHTVGFVHEHTRTHWC